MARRPFDFYETPPHYTDALVKVFPVLQRKTTLIVEPCVGEGAITSAMHPAECITNDINRRRRADYYGDATKAKTWAPIRFAMSPGHGHYAVVTNPPFNAALAILEHALDLDCAVHFLLRLSFLEPTEDRGPLLEACPPQHLIVLPRYSFALNSKGKRGNDSVTCAWMSWNCGKTDVIVNGTRPALLRTSKPKRRKRTK
jgi:hypothetical protein